MPPDNTIDNKPKNILIKVIIGIIITFIIAIGAFYIYTYYYVSNTTIDTPIALEKPPEKPQVFIEEEKLQILEGLSIENTEAISEKERLKTLDTLSKQSSEITLSEEEKLKILNSLSQ